MNTPENPSAFPYSGELDEYGRAKSPMGMNIRDYFAAKAMARMIPEEGWMPHSLEKCAKQAAKDAYIVADAMLIERAKV